MPRRVLGFFIYLCMTFFRTLYYSFQNLFFKQMYLLKASLLFWTLNNLSFIKYIW